MAHGKKRMFTQEEIWRIKKDYAGGMPLTKVAKKNNVDARKIAKTLNITQNKYTSAASDNFENAKIEMMRTRKKWDKFEVGQAVGVVVVDDRKKKKWKGEIISKNKYYVGIKCKNRVATITFSDLVCNRMQIIPLSETVVAQISTELSK